MKITSSTIKSLLSIKHSSDVFVTECKLGSAGSRIMDGWAMKKSWANQCYTGYEIKVSRGDFLQDEKHVEYLKCCNQFYFVCPSGLIDKSEVGDNCGLIYTSSNGKKLFVKKKAPLLNHDESAVNNVLSYIMMCRISGICDSTFGKNAKIESNIDYWEKWLSNREHYRSIGRSVSKDLQKRFSEEVESVKKENVKLSDANHQLQDIKDFLSELGIDPNGYFKRWSVNKALRGKKNDFVNTLKKLSNNASILIDMIEKDEQ